MLYPKSICFPILPIGHGQVLATMVLKSSTMPCWSCRQNGISVKWEFVKVVSGKWDVGKMASRQNGVGKFYVGKRGVGKMGEYEIL